MKLKLSLYSFLYYCCFFATVSAIDLVNIEGYVINDIGSPLVGSNIIIKNTAYGGATDTDGFYQFSIPIEVARSSPLIFASYIGYRSTVDTLLYNNEKKIIKNFQLNRDVLDLESIVVTGMGAKQYKEKLGVSIESVKGEAVVKAGEVNMITSLRGNVPGLEIRKTSGDAGTNAFFRIRGTGTISGSHEPLIIVDGSPVSNRTYDSGGSETSERGHPESSSRTGDINVEDIETIEVLKGAAASAIYGSRASNGVIMITTKSGRTGKTQLTYKFQAGISALNNKYPVQQWFGQGKAGNFIQGEAFSWGKPLNIKGSPWFDDSRDIDQVFDHIGEISDYGNSYDHNVSAYGGSDKTTFYLSMSKSYEKSHWLKFADYKKMVSTVFGHIPNRDVPSDYERYTVRLKGSHLIRDNLTLTGSMSYVNVSVNSVMRAHTTDGLGKGLLSTPPDFDLKPYLNPVTQYHRSSTDPNSLTPEGDHSWNNPYWVLYEAMQKQHVDRLYGSIQLDFRPTDWGSLKYTMGTDYSLDERTEVLPIGTYREGGIGRLIREDIVDQEFDGNLVFNIDGNKLFNLPMNLMMGHNLNSRYFRSYEITGLDQTLPNYFQMENYSSIYADERLTLRHAESFFIQGTYDLFDELYLTSAIRNDGSSTFGPSDRRHNFRKFSAAWNFSKRLKIPYLNFGKLRYAFGEAGEQPNVYTIYSGYMSPTSFSAGDKVNLALTYNGLTGYRSDDRIGNMRIRPERRTENEIGVDLSFLEDKIGINFTSYKALNSDVIFTIDVIPSTGSDEQTANGAIIENKGLEFVINTNPIRKKNLSWSSRFIYASNTNMVLEMNGVSGDEAKNMDYSQVPSVGISKFSEVSPGHTLGEFRGYTWARFGYGITAKDFDENGNTVYINIDSVYAGQWKRNDVYIQRDGYPDTDWLNREYVWTGYDPNPDWTGSFYNEVELFGKIKFSCLIDISMGGHIVNYTKNALYEWGTHGDTENRYHSSFDNPNWHGYEEGVSTEWGKGKISDMLNNGANAIGPGTDQIVAFDEIFYTTIAGRKFDIINNIEDASYIKLREISLAYQMTNKYTDYLGLKSMSLRLSARDLITWTKYSGWDPETNMYQNRISGEDYFNQPQTWGTNFTLYFNW